MSEWGSQNFPTSLNNLILRGGSTENDVIDISNLSHLFPSYLTSLNICDLKKLETVSMGLRQLTSLQHLYIQYCPKTMNLPETLLPSLLSIRIIGCSKLTERCSKSGRGSYYYWPRISHIPCIYIDRKITKLISREQKHEAQTEFILSSFCSMTQFLFLVTHITQPDNCFSVSLVGSYKCSKTRRIR